MKFIVKGVSPNELEAWKSSKRPKRWNDLHSSLPNEMDDGVTYYSKDQLRTVLHQEQYEMCCYCNAKIRNDHTSPIDHLEPREGDTQTDRIFDYNNLLLSCDGGQKENINPKILHCDAVKKSKSIGLTPLMIECEEEIYFTEEGEIEATTNRGNEAINVLALGLISISNNRKAAIIPYLYSDFESEDPAQLLPQEEIVRSYNMLQENHNIQYWSAIVSVLKGYVR